MTLTNSTKLASAEAQADFTEAAAAETVAEAAVALAMEGVTPAVNGDWTYSATAESVGGEVAGSGGHDLDAAPGLIYSGPAGGAVRIKVAGLDILEGTIAPEAADSVAAAVFVNNDLVDYFDEGFVDEIDTATAVEMNLDTYLGGLQPLDVVRIGLVGGGEETADWDVAVGGSINII